MMTKSMMTKFDKILRLSQKDLKTYLEQQLNKNYEVINEDGFLYAKGEVPILLVAHLDTVHKELVKQIIKKDGIWSSPQGIGGDDRCGVFMIMEIIKKHKCHVLFCEDEEIGGIGASKFTKSKYAKELDVNFIIELDRKSRSDAVFYECANTEFEDFITMEYFTTDWGSFSDISIIAPYVGVAAVNLSCGYYKAHTKDEYIKIEEMMNSIEKVCDIINRMSPDIKYEYIYDDYYDNYDYYGYFGSSKQNKKLTLTNIYCIEFEEGETYKVAEVEAYSEDEAVGKFLKEYWWMSYSDILWIEKC